MSQQFPRGLDVELLGQYGSVMRGIVLATRFANTPSLFSHHQVLIKITHHDDSLINKEDWPIGKEMWVEHWMLRPTSALQVLAETAE